MEICRIFPCAVSCGILFIMTIVVVLRLSYPFRIDILLYCLSIQLDHALIDFGASYFPGTIYSPPFLPLPLILLMAPARFYGSVRRTSDQVTDGITVSTR